MNRLWLINYKTDVGVILTETSLVWATCESQARCRLSTYIDEFNGNNTEVKIYDYFIVSIEPYDEGTHGPQHFFEIINE